VGIAWLLVMISGDINQVMPFGQVARSSIAIY
jgi:hypothetical protein